MNIIELMYLSMNPYNEQLATQMNFDQYVKEYRTLRMDNGRATGKTHNLCEFITKYKFDKVCYVCHSSNFITNLNKILETYSEIYHYWGSQVYFIPHNKMEDEMRGRQYDVIIFDAYSFYKTKLKFNYGLSLKKGGIIIKVG